MSFWLINLWTLNPLYPATLKIAVPSYDSNMASVLKLVSEKFTREHSAIEIEIIDVKAENSEAEKFNSSEAFIHTHSFDIVFTTQRMLSAPIAANQVASLEDKLSREQLALFPASLLNNLRLDNKLYALPSIAHVYTLYVNTDLLDRVGAKIPTTWNDVYNIAKLLTEKTDAYGYGIHGKGPDIEKQFLYLAWNMDGGILNKTPEKTQSILNSKGSIRAAKWLYSMIDNGYTQPNVTAYDRKALATLFYRNKLGLFISDATPVEQFQKNSSPVKFVQVRIPSESINLKNKNSTPLGAMEVVYLSKNSAYPEEALKFLMYMLASDSRAEWMAEKGLLPTTKPPYKKVFQKPSLKLPLELLPEAQFLELHIKTHEILTIINTELPSLYNHQSSPETSMQRLHQKVTELLQSAD